MTKADQLALLQTIKAGEVFEYGQLLAGAAPDENIVWQCLENKELENGRRVTFHLSYFGVYFAPIVAKVSPEGAIVWSGGIVG